MRRDERAFDPTEGHAEIAAIESQWTRIWEAQGGPKDRAESIKRREEFKIMWPHIQQMPKGSRLLDGGCGLGDWVAWFTRAGYPTLGLDISAVTIGQLRKLHADLEFEVGDIRATGLPAGSFDGYFQRRFLNPEGGDEDVLVWTSDQGFGDAARHICRDIEVVLRAARYYAENGGFDPAVTWEECQRLPRPCT